MSSSIMIFTIISASVLIFSFSSLFQTYMFYRYNKEDIKNYFILHLLVVVKQIVFFIRSCFFTSPNLASIFSKIDLVLLPFLLFQIMLFIDGLYNKKQRAVLKTKFGIFITITIFVGVILYIIDEIASYSFFSFIIAILFYSIFFILILRGYILNRNVKEWYWFSKARILYISLLILIPIITINELIPGAISSYYFYSALLLFLAWSLISTIILTMLANKKSVKNDNKAGLNSDVLTCLTKRETQIATELKKGLTYQEIADSLNVSLATVKTHIYNIYQKLEVRNKIELIDLLARS